MLVCWAHLRGAGICNNLTMMGTDNEDILYLWSFSFSSKHSPERVLGVILDQGCIEIQLCGGGDCTDHLLTISLGLGHHGDGDPSVWVVLETQALFWVVAGNKCFTQLTISKIRILTMSGALRSRHQTSWTPWWCRCWSDHWGCPWGFPARPACCSRPDQSPPW